MVISSLQKEMCPALPIAMLARAPAGAAYGYRRRLTFRLRRTVL
jgi:hypothetical protein